MRDVSFGIYLRDDQVIVCPSSWGIDIDPVMIVIPVPDIASLGAIALQALKDSPRMNPPP